MHTNCRLVVRTQAGFAAVAVVGDATCPPKGPAALMDPVAVMAVPKAKLFQAGHCSVAALLVGPPLGSVDCLQMGDILSKTSTLTLLQRNAVGSVDIEYQAIVTALCYKLWLVHFIESLHEARTH